MANWITLALVIVIVVGYFIFRAKRESSGKSGSGFLSRLLPSPKPDIEKIREQTTRAQERAKELEEVQEAKRELMRAKAKCSNLQKDIAGMTEQSVEKLDRQGKR